MDIRIVQCKRLGKSPTTNEGRPQPRYLWCLSQPPFARDVIASAMYLRRFTDEYVRGNVFINADLASNYCPPLIISSVPFSPFQLSSANPHPNVIVDSSMQPVCLSGFLLHGPDYRIVNKPIFDILNIKLVLI